MTLLRGDSHARLLSLETHSRLEFSLREGIESRPSLLSLTRAERRLNPTS